jgi:hypothetical protein
LMTLTIFGLRRFVLRLEKGTGCHSSSNAA